MWDSKRNSEKLTIRPVDKSSRIKPEQAINKKLALQRTDKPQILTANNSVANVEGPKSRRLGNKVENVDVKVVEKNLGNQKVSSISGSKGVVKKAKKIKDPNAPKRPGSAFMIFSAEKKNDLRHLSFGEKGEDWGSGRGIGTWVHDDMFKF